MTMSDKLVRLHELDTKSIAILSLVHPDLAKVVRAASLITPVPFIVTEGLRNRGRQAELYRKGATRTMRSRHLTGHAVDVAAKVGGVVRWDWPLYDKIALAMKAAADELGVPLEWGGDWVSFRDGPHFQLPWEKYPA